MQTIAECYIGLGSNLSFEGNQPFDLICSSLFSLQTHTKIELLSYSSCYLSKPQGPQDQADFHNAAAKINTSLSPLSLLYALQAIEANHGLDRNKKQHWGPRELDLDILLFNREHIQQKNLTIPHPQIQNRNFVLLPLLELSPGLSLPSGKKVKSLAENCSRTGIIKLNRELQPLALCK